MCLFNLNNNHIALLERPCEFYYLCGLFLLMNVKVWSAFHPFFSFISYS
nr:MAG TPA: ribosome, tRNA, helicase, RIBOSOME [Caudoviricetes sp.]